MCIDLAGGRSDWARKAQVKWHYIAPGKPMQSGNAEASNGRMRDEPWIARGWSFRVSSGQRAGFAAGICKLDRRLVTDRAVGSVLVVVSEPSLHLFADTAMKLKMAA